MLVARAGVGGVRFRGNALQHARRNFSDAEYTLQHAPADHMPFWDYASPLVPNDVRDSFAASVLASGLLILAEQDHVNAGRWHDAATTILQSLWENYSSRGTNEPSILIHGLLDHGLIYGDYYFVEALGKLEHVGVQ